MKVTDLNVISGAAGFGPDGDEFELRAEIKGKCATGSNVRSIGSALLGYLNGSNMKSSPDKVLDLMANEKLADSLAEAMAKFGGHFAKNLANAYIYADAYNRKILLLAFPDLFLSYVAFLPKEGA